mgnify:CR=1 FL=1|jgi:hypothetical protein
MDSIEKLLVEAAGKALADEFPGFKDNIEPDLNIFDLVDSFSVVNILLESEAAIEYKTGKYISLASEKIFDAINSPFLKWSNWLAYVESLLRSEGM